MGSKFATSGPPAKIYSPWVRPTLFASLDEIAGWLGSSFPTARHDINPDIDGNTLKKNEAKVRRPNTILT